MSPKKLTAKEAAKIGVTSKIDKNMKLKHKKSTFERVISAMAHTSPISNKEIIKKPK